MNDIERRVGRFTIQHLLIRENPVMVMRLLRNVLITRAESMHYRDAIEYIGQSFYFDVLEDGYDIPIYTAQVTKRVNEDTSEVEHDIEWIREGS